MTNELKITLGEKQFNIKKLPGRRASGWRRNLKGPLLKIVGLVAQLSKEGVELKDLEQTDVSALAPMLETIISDVHDALEYLPDVVLDYMRFTTRWPAPQIIEHPNGTQEGVQDSGQAYWFGDDGEVLKLHPDEYYIYENAPDEEYIAAFIQMVQASYPFGMLVRQARRAGSLINPRPTSPS